MRICNLAGRERLRAKRPAILMPETGSQQGRDARPLRKPSMPNPFSSLGARQVVFGRNWGDLDFWQF
jgi:hypothetical protein